MSLNDCKDLELMTSPGKVSGSTCTVQFLQGKCVSMCVSSATT